MLAGALGALAQNDIRRVLNYSIMSSVGAMVLGIALGTPLALMGAVFYLAQDMVVKANLYLAAGSAELGVDRWVSAVRRRSPTTSGS